METSLTPQKTEQFISISDLFSQSIETYKKNWKLFTAIQAVPFIVSVLSIVTALATKSAGFVLFYIIASLIVSGFSWLALLWVITQKDTDTGADLFEHTKHVYKNGLSLAIPVTVAGLLAGLLTLGGFILLIIPGIYLAISYSFVIYIVGHEGIKGMDALRASTYYVKGHWWGILGRSLLFGIAIGIIQMIFSAGSVAPQWETIRQAIGNGVEPQVTSSPILEILSNAFTTFVSTPLSMIYTFLMYKSLKSIKGNYTVKPN
jgi:hypothetical protein